MSKLHGHNIFKGFDTSPYSIDLQGWGHDDPVFEEVISQIRPGIIVEVGTWKGASAIRMAELAPKAIIVCIDTWLGGQESYTGKVNLDGEHLMRKHGWPHMYYQFLANVCLTGKTENIIPLPQTSQNGAVILHYHNISCDLCYLDASHEFNDVYLDLLTYTHLLNDKGVIIGDDFSRQGIRDALSLFIPRSEFICYARGNKYILVKDSVVQIPEGFNKIQ
jgi:hypothetical protein